MFCFNKEVCCFNKEVCCSTQLNCGHNKCFNSPLELYSRSVFYVHNITLVCQHYQYFDRLGLHEFGKFAWMYGFGCNSSEFYPSNLKTTGPCHTNVHVCMYTQSFIDSRNEGLTAAKG